MKKLLGTFALFKLSGAWWIAAVQPVILSLGAILAAIDLDVLDLQPFELKIKLPFINKLKKDAQWNPTEETPLLDADMENNEWMDWVID